MHSIVESFLIFSKIMPLPDSSFRPQAVEIIEDSQNWERRFVICEAKWFWWTGGSGLGMLICSNLFKDEMLPAFFLELVLHAETHGPDTCSEIQQCILVFAACADDKHFPKTPVQISLQKLRYTKLNWRSAPDKLRWHEERCTLLQSILDWIVACDTRHRQDAGNTLLIVMERGR